MTDKEKWHEIFKADCDEGLTEKKEKNNVVFSGSSLIILDTTVFPNKLAEEKEQ